MPIVAFVNHADRLSNRDADVIVEALRLQAINDFARLWQGIDLWVPLFVRSDQELPQNAYPIAFVNSPDVADVMAYHSVDRGGKYFGHVFVDPLLQRGSAFGPLAVAAGHEYFEMLGDPTTAKVVIGPALPQGDRYLFELCDPVQTMSYTKTVVRGGRIYSVSCSDAVGPAYFGAGAGPLSIMNAPLAPFQLAPGGYQIVQNDSGDYSNVFAAELPPEHVRLANEQRSRVARRLAAGVLRPTEVIDVSKLARISKI